MAKGDLMDFELKIKGRIISGVSVGIIKNGFLVFNLSSENEAMYVPNRKH